MSTAMLYFVICGKSNINFLIRLSWLHGLAVFGASLIVCEVEVGHIQGWSHYVGFIIITIMQQKNVSLIECARSRM